MYQDFFHLTARPFSLLPDPDFLFLSRRHGRTVSHLEFGSVTEAGFIVITGDIGAGKTTIVRHFLQHKDRQLTVGLINAGGTPGNLLGWIASAFELVRTGRDEVDLHGAFVDFLVGQYGKGNRTVLVIDEAQNLSRDVLEELRVLSNVNYGKDQLLQIILVGQGELLETLKRPDMQQFRQRIAVHCHLEPLSAKETTGYIAHRLAVVGGAPGIFTRDALIAVHYYTGGVPRLINLLCDQALTYAFSEDERSVTAQTIVEAVADRAGSGLCPFPHADEDWAVAKRSEEVKAIRRELAQGAQKS